MSALPAETALSPHQPTAYDAEPNGVKPRRKLWPTRLRRPRSVRKFAPRLSFDAAAPPVDATEAMHWGEYTLIEDIISVLHRDGTVTWLRHVATWVFGSANLAEWDEVLRYYDTRREVHRVLAAKLYLPDGKTQNAKRASHVLAAPGPSSNRYGRSLQINYFPLRPGVIVEFEEQYDEFVVQDGGPSLINQFFLRTAVPCLQRRYTAVVAAPFQLHWQVHHDQAEPQVSQLKDYCVHTWQVQNAQGIEGDSWTPPGRDFLPWIDISTADRWNGFAQRLHMELAPRREATAEVRKLARELSADADSPLAKAQSAYAYAARQVRYGRPPAELEARNTRAASAVFADLRGDCKDKSSLLIELLEAMGIEAKLAVVLTADEGRTSYLPSTRFNHAIVRATIDGQHVWLDAASGLFGFGQMPDSNIDVAALMLDDAGFYFERVPLPDDNYFETRRRWQGEIDAAGNFEGRLQAEFNGEMAARLRHALLDRNEEHRTQVLRTWFGNDYPGFDADKFEYSDPEDLSRPLACSCAMRAERMARWVEDALLVQPPWFAPAAMSGPFASPTRLQPLTIPVFHQTDEQHTIELPPGVTPLAVPAPASHACDWGRYQCRIEAESGRLRCRRRFRLAGSMAPVDRFGEFRQFWKQLNWADTNPVVMSRAR